MIEEPYRESDGTVSIYEVIDGARRRITHKDIWSDSTTDNERREFLKKISQVVWDLPEKIEPRDAPRNEEGRPDYAGVAMRIERYLRKYVYIENEDAYPLLATWVIMTYNRKYCNYSPLIIIDGVTSAGKSTLQEALAKISYRGFCTTNYSSAAIVRLIKRSNISVFLDEALDNITGERGSDLMNLIKSVVTKRTPYVRAVPKSKDDVEVCYPFSSMAVSVKGAEIATDVVNRGIRIQMVMKPMEIELGNLSWSDVDDMGTDLTPTSIRTDLYNLMILQEISKEDTKIQWPEKIAESIKYLTKRMENGEWMYGFIYEIKKAPKITNRLRDIATALLPVAMVAENEREVLQAIIDTDKVHRESTEASMESHVFRALVDCIKNRIDEVPLVKQLDWRAKTKYVTEEVFIEATKRVTTKEIADRYNTVAREEGELNTYEIVETRRVTYTLKSLGMTYTVGRGAGGRASTMAPMTEGFVRLFMQHLVTYDTENVDYFSNIVAK